MMAVDNKTAPFRLGNLFGILSIVLLSFAAVGCGEEEPPPKPKTKKTSKKKAKKKSSGGAAASAGGFSVNAYKKIPEDHRRELGENDFKVDRTGEENRDPFHSFVLFPSERLDGNEVVKVTNVCDKAEWVASEVSISSLSLVGIVSHGTRGWAQFTDPTGLGHIVGRSQCLGKEKAMVEQVGDSFVRLRVIPEAAPGAATPPAETKDYSLSPDDLQLRE